MSLPTRWISGRTVFWDAGATLSPRVALPQLLCASNGAKLATLQINRLRVTRTRTIDKDKTDDRSPTERHCDRQGEMTDKSAPTALDLGPYDDLDEWLTGYFEKCEEKLGFVPNVLRA